MKTHLLRDIVAVAEKGSLRAAARHLGITQPSITRSIREVEAELGAALFVRQRTGVVPSAAGAMYLRRAAAVLRDMERAREEFQQLHGHLGGRVAIGLSTVSAPRLLPLVLERFRGRYPQVDVRVQEGLMPRMQHGLESGELDFYIGPLSHHVLPHALRAERLHDQPGAVFCRQGHPLSAARHLAELQGARWLTASLTEGEDTVLGPLFAQHGLPAPKIEMHLDATLTLLVSLGNSDLLALLPEQFMHYPGLQHTLTTLPLREQLAAPAVYSVTRSDTVMTPAAEYLHEMLCTAARDGATTPA